MKTALYGRVVFGASAVLFGVIALLWHDAYTWQELARILKLPLGRVAGDTLMIAQIAGGIGLLFPRTVRIGSIVLGVVYALFALASILGIVAHPKVFDPYDGFFEQFSLFCGALAIYVVTDPSGVQSPALERVSRLGFGFCVISFTVAQAVFLKETADLVPKWIPPNQMFWAVLTTIAFALAAVAILINRQARLAIRLLSLMIVLFGLLVWVPILVAHPETHFGWSEFAINFLIAGAASMVGELKSAEPTAQLRRGVAQHPGPSA